MTIIVLDNDETTGYYTHLMTYMNFILRCRKLSPDEEVSIIPLVTQIASDHGIFRPGTAQFLQAISERKKLGIVKAVVMYTNAFANPALSWHTASWGVVDWTHFLARVLGCLAGNDTLFDVVLSRPPHLLHMQYPKKHFTRIVESLTAVHSVTEDTRIVFFDDKPDEIMGVSERFITVHAPEYKVPLTIAQIDNMMQRLFPADAVLSWSTLTREAVYHEITTMSTRCADSAIPVPTHSEPVSWCAFDIDRELPLSPSTPSPPPPPKTTITTPTLPTSFSVCRSRSLRIQFRIVIRRMRKRKWSAVTNVYVKPRWKN